MDSSCILKNRLCFFCSLLSYPIFGWVGRWAIQFKWENFKGIRGEIILKCQQSIAAKKLQQKLNIN